MRIPFIGPSNPVRSVQVDAQRTINWYPEISGSGEKAPIVLYPRPGLTSFASTSTGEVRAMLPFNGDLYAVVGASFHKITLAAAVTTEGTINTNKGRVGIAAGRDYLMIVDGTDGWTWDGTTFAKISDADFPSGVTHVTVFDGYFIVNNGTAATNDQFHWSAIDDPTTWAATDTATAEKKPDKLQAIIDRHQELWLIGERSVEVWFNSGATDTPFEPIKSAFSEWGTIAPYSVARADNYILWLSQNNQGRGMVVMASGYNPIRVSTHGIEAFIETFTLTDAFAYSVQIYGHTFYVLTFPTDKATLVYDLTAGLWHEWDTLGKGGRFIAQSYAYFNNAHYMGDMTDGTIYEFDPASYTDNGKEILRVRYSQFAHAERRLLFHRALEVEMEYGQGLATGDSDETDPQVMLQWSDDGGHTYSNELWRDIGKIGEYRNRAMWRQLGSSRDRVYKVMVSDPVKAVLISGYLHADPSERPLT